MVPVSSLVRMSHALAFIAAVSVGLSHATAQTVDPYYDADYAFDVLGAIPGVPSPYGGLTMKEGAPDIMLIGGNANRLEAAIYEITVERGCVGQITGFVGEATVFATAPYIDGGLAYGPDGVLFYTTFNTNTLGQIKPASTAPDKIIDLTKLGVTSSTGTLNFVPDGFPGAGRLKIASYTASDWFDATVAPDGTGTFDLVDVQFIAHVGGGPEGIVYIPATNPQFDGPSALLTEYSGSAIAAYGIDADGNPIPASRRTFMTGLTGAEGAAIDREVGDFLFSTFGGASRVIVVRGFTNPCAADVAPPGGDGVVAFSDVLVVLGLWGETCTGRADINQDGIVDFTDLLQVLAQWGPC